MRRTTLVLCLSLALAGCAHELVLTPQDGIGPMGHGGAPAKLVSYHGELAVDLGGKHYTGEWTLQNSGGFVGSGVGFSGGQVATGTLIGASTNGNGKAYLTEAGGDSLSCDFSYSEWSGTGVGVCRTAAGKLYNLMIH